MRTAIFAVVISIFLLLYGGMHYYALLKFLSVFPGYRRAVTSAFVVLGCSIFFVVIFTHGNFMSWLARPLAFISFTWMGLIFLFFTLSVTIDALEKLVGLADWYTLQGHIASPRRTVVAAIFVIVVGIYGYYASHRFTIEKVALTSSRIASPVKIIQITDLHLGLLSNEHYFQGMVNAINAMHADIIVCTGDMVDMQMDHLDGLGELMSRLSAKRGKYAVYGNHEVFAGLEASHAFTKRVGFTLLSNRGITIDNLINVVGVDDPAVAGRVKNSDVDEPGLLKSFDNGLFTLLLKHQPVIEPASIGHFDLQLSGHIHGGQIFPFGLLTRLVYEVPNGLSVVADGRWLYVSRGTGTWGPPMRVLAPPEITLLELHPLR